MFGQRLLKSLAMVGIAALSSGCIDSDSDSNNASETRINSFSVSGDQIDGRTHLAANQPFKLNWSTKHGGMRSIHVYLSKEPQLESDTPYNTPRIFSCGEGLGGDFSNDHCRPTVECEYGNDNILECAARIEQNHQVVDLADTEEGNFIEEDAYLIMRVTSFTEYFFTSDTRAIPVRLR